MVIFQQDVFVIIIVTFHHRNNHGEDKYRNQQKYDKNGKPDNKQLGQDGNHDIHYLALIMDYRHDYGSHQT